MKKPLIKVLLPITALLLSSCSFTDWFKNIFSKNEQGQKEEEQKTDPEKQTYPGNPIEIDIPDSLPLTVGQTKALSISYNPQDAENKVVEWVSSNPSVATYSDGQVTALSVGETKITATTKNRLGETIKSECNVVVTDPSTISKTTLKYTYDDYCANSAYPFDNTPLVGNPKLLVIPVWFSDSDTFISMSHRELVRDDIRKSFFGTNEEAGWRSLKTYYEEEAQGMIEIGGTITEWYETGESYEVYASDSSGGYKTETLVETASTYYFNNSSETAQDYDSNNDGYLDGVILVYAAPDYDSLGVSSNNLWAYTSWLMGLPDLSNPTPNVYFWGSYDFMYSSGIKAYERTELSMYGRGDTRHCVVDPHCFIHEMGHVFGLQDYYDYSGQHCPAGGFCMQDMNVGGHDAYSVMAFGWAKPYIPTETSTIIINDFQSSHDMILLANHEVDSPFDEYMLLEFYSPTGLNKFDSDYHYNDRYPLGPKQVGIRLWHVDARLTYWTGAGWSKTLVSNPTRGDVYHAMSNTYYSDWASGYSPLGKSYADFNTLQLIRCEGKSPYFSNNAIFGYGSSFTMNDYTDQFVKAQRMNDGKSLGWTFSVSALDETSAAITVTKL